MPPSTRSGLLPSTLRRSRSRMAYSSVVLEWSVPTRQSARSLAPSKRPQTMFELPMSIASNIRLPQVYDISGADFENLSILGKKTQRAVRGKPFGCPFNLFTADQFDPDRFPNGVARHSIRGGDVIWPVAARGVVQSVPFSHLRAQEPPASYSGSCLA